jgi:DNA-binding NarL/FixJ family response regulator
MSLTSPSPIVLPQSPNRSSFHVSAKTPTSSPLPPSVQIAKAKRFDSREPSIVIAKHNRLDADTIHRAARAVYPKSKVELFYRGEDVMQRLRRRPADLGLFGLSFPDIDGLDIVTMVVRERLIAGILVITGRRGEHSRRFLRYAGIVGFFDCHGDDPSELPRAIRQVGAGGNYFSHTWQDTDLHKGKHSLNSLLTMKEQQVFTVIGDGSDDQEAARSLAMNPHTVRTHREKIMTKLGLHTRIELVREAEHRGVVRMVEGRVLRPGLDSRLVGPRTPEYLTEKCRDETRMPSEATATRNGS